jgi:hypothetical protein
MRASIDANCSWKCEIGGLDEGFEYYGESVSVDADDVFCWICGFSVVILRGRS